MKRKALLYPAIALLLLGLGYRYLIPKPDTLTVWSLSAAEGGLPAVRVDRGETILFQQAGGQKLMGGVTHNGAGLTFFQYDPAALSKLGLPYQVMNLSGSATSEEPQVTSANSLPGVPAGVPIGKASGEKFFSQVTREEDTGSAREVVTYYDVDGDGWPEFKRTPDGLFRVAKITWEMTAEEEEGIRGKLPPPVWERSESPEQKYLTETPAAH